MTTIIPSIQGLSLSQPLISTSNATFNTVSTGTINNTGNIASSSLNCQNVISTNATISNALTLPNSDTSAKLIKFNNNGVSYGITNAQLVALATNGDGTYASQSYVDNKISQLISSAPSLLDNLQEISQAINNDPVFSQTVTNQIATKSSLSAANTFAGTQTFNNAVTVNGSTNLKNTILTGQLAVNKLMASYDVDINGSLNANSVYIAGSNLATTLAGINSTISSNQTGANSSITSLSSTVTNNYNTLNTAISNLSATETSNYNALNTLITNNKTATDGSIATLSNTVTSNKAAADSSISTLTTSLNNKIDNSGSQIINGSLQVNTLKLNNGCIYNNSVTPLNQDWNNNNIGLSIAWNAYGRGESCLISCGNTLASGHVLMSTSTDATYKIPARLMDVFETTNGGIVNYQKTYMKDDLTLQGSSKLVLDNGSSFTQSSLQALVQREGNFMPGGGSITQVNTYTITAPFYKDYFIYDLPANNLLTITLPSYSQTAFNGEELNIIYYGPEPLNGESVSVTLQCMSSSYTFVLRKGERMQRLKLFSVSSYNYIYLFREFSLDTANTWTDTQTFSTIVSNYNVCNGQTDGYILNATGYMSGIHKPRFTQTYAVSAGDQLDIDFTGSLNTSLYQTFNFDYGPPTVKAYLVMDTSGSFTIGGGSVTGATRQLIPINVVTSNTGVTFYGCSISWVRVTMGNQYYYRLNVNFSGSGIAYYISDTGTPQITSGNVMITVE